MKKTALTALALFMASMGISVSAEETAPNGDIIITDNFKVINKSHNNDDRSLLLMKQENTIGSLGSKTVVVGEKSPAHVAFVKSANGRNYIIENRILVQCKKGINCIPAGITGRQMSANTYLVTVDSYDEWQSTQKILKEAPDVRKVSPSVYTGKKPQLK